MKAYVALQTHLPELSVNEVLQEVQAPVNCVHAEQLDEQGPQTLFPRLYCPVGQVIGLTQTPLTNAEVELQPHRPAEGVFVTNDVLHVLQNPVLLTLVQFAGMARHVFVPSLY